MINADKSCAATWRPNSRRTWRRRRRWKKHFYLRGLRDLSSHAHLAVELHAQVTRTIARFDCILADNNTSIRWRYGLQWRRRTEPHNVSFGNVQLQSEIRTSRQRQQYTYSAGSLLQTPVIEKRVCTPVCHRRNSDDWRRAGRKDSVHFFCVCNKRLWAQRWALLRRSRQQPSPTHQNSDELYMSDWTGNTSTSYTSSSYWRSTGTMAVSCIDSKLSEILVENRDFFIPHLHSTPPLRGTSSEFRQIYFVRETRMVGEQRWKEFDDTFSIAG